MGGKRPDQYQIDGGEAGTTDYKRLRQDDGVKNQEKAELTVKDESGIQRAQPQGKEQIPQTPDNPAQAELKARNAERRDDGSTSGSGGVGDQGGARRG